MLVPRQEFLRPLVSSSFVHRTPCTEEMLEDEKKLPKIYLSHKHQILCPNLASVSYSNQIAAFLISVSASRVSAQLCKREIHELCDLKEPAWPAQSPPGFRHHLHDLPAKDMDSIKLFRGEQCKGVILW